MRADPLVEERKGELLAETQVLLDAIRSLGSELPDPLLDVDVLARAVAIGLLDAPQLVNNPFARGAIRTRSLEGAIRTVDRVGNPIPEQQRVRACLHAARGALSS